MVLNSKKKPSPSTSTPACDRRISEPMPIVECDERPFRLINPFAPDAAFQAGLVSADQFLDPSGSRPTKTDPSRQSRCDPFGPNPYASRPTLDHQQPPQHARPSVPHQLPPNGQSQPHRPPQSRPQSMHQDVTSTGTLPRSSKVGTAARPRLPPGSIPAHPTAHEMHILRPQGAQSPSAQFPPNTAFQQMHLMMGPGATPYPHPLPPPIPQSIGMDTNPSHYSLLTQTQPPFPLGPSHGVDPAYFQLRPPPPPKGFHGMPQHPPAAPPTIDAQPQRQARVPRAASAATSPRPMSYPTHQPAAPPSAPATGGRPASRNSVHFNASLAGAAPPPSLIPKRGKSCLRPVVAPAAGASGQTVPWEVPGPIDSTPGGAPPRPRSAPPVAGSLRTGAQLLHRLNVLLGSGSGMVERFVDVHEVMEPGRACAMQPEPAVGGGMKKTRSSMGMGAALGMGQGKKQSGKERAFGLPLEAAPDGSICQTVIGTYAHKIPYVVFTIVEEILQRGMSTPGIFRLVGDSARCLNLYSIFNTGPTFGTSLDVGNEPIHNLCGVLKLYLRELPEPLVHPSIWRALLAFCVEPDPKEVVIPESARIAAAQILLRLMPPRYFSLLVYLLAFLTQVPKYDNRLTQTSVSIIFGPMLVAPRGFGIPSIGPSDQMLKVPPPALNPDGSTITPRPSQDYSGLVGQSQAVLLWLTTNWDALSDGLFELDLDIGDIEDDQAKPVAVAAVAPPPPAPQQTQPFREPELIQQPEASPPRSAVRQVRKAVPTFDEPQQRPQSWAASPSPRRKDSDNDSIQTLNNDDDNQHHPSQKTDGYFSANSKTAIKATTTEEAHHQQLTQLVALIHEKNREADALRATVDALTRERDHARRAQEEDEWRGKCREMEFAKNRAMIELANERFKVQELTAKLAQPLPAAPTIVVQSEEDAVASARQHELQLNRYKLRVSELSTELETVKRERDRVNRRLEAVFGAVDSARA